MARPYPIGSDALIAGLMMPTTNWGQHMAAKDQQLQQQAYLTQMSEQELLQEQQAAAQIANFKQRIRSLPMERPDKVRVSKWLQGQEKDVANRLANDYQGNLAKFMAAEGSQWMQQTLGSLEQSEEYTTGIHNLEQITLAKEALRKGENLIGEVQTVGGKQQYVAATQRIQEYYAGRLPKFNFAGSYKDDDDAVKHFGSQYGPSKYQRTAVPQAEVLNYLMASKNPEVAQDMYLRKYASGAKLFYKVDPLEDFQDHNMKIQDHGMRVQDHGMRAQDHRLNTILKGKQIQGADLSNAIKRQKLSGLSESNGVGDPGAYLRRMIPQSQAQPDIEYSHDSGSKILPHSGYDLTSFGGKARGVVNFKALDIFDKQSVEGLGSLIGAEKVPVSKQNPTGWRGGKILEGIVAKNGFNAIDLAGTSHQVVHVDPKLYTNPRDTGSDGPMGFVKTTIRFDSNADAKKAGLLDKGMFGADNKVGVGAYNSDTHEVTLYAPVGNLFKNAALNRYLSVQDAGQKVTNDFANPYALGSDDDDE